MLKSQNNDPYIKHHPLPDEQSKSREIQVDNQVVGRVTLPKALRATYHEADPPPPLQILQVYGDKDYTWVEIML